jgi:hypothetical protein
MENPTHHAQRVVAASVPRVSLCRAGCSPILVETSTHHLPGPSPDKRRYRNVASFADAHRTVFQRERSINNRHRSGSNGPYTHGVPGEDAVKVDPNVWKLGSWIAAVRLIALWSIVIGFRYGDWRQVPGYLLSMLILPETLLVRGLRNDQPRWTAYLAVLIFFASYFYAGIVVRLRRELK